jgi:glucosamine-phosphate N-acetyltransferase
MNDGMNVDAIFKLKSNENYLYRFLEENDYNKGFFELLSQLTMADKCEFSAWKDKFKEMTSIQNMDIIVIEDRKTGMIVGSITLIYEPKFIRGLGYVCHIEDFVIDANHRKHKLGSIMLDISIAFSKLKKCYKIILDCEEKVQGFYQKNGFSVKSKGMALYLNK